MLLEAHEILARKILERAAGGQLILHHPLEERFAASGSADGDPIDQRADLVAETILRSWLEDAHLLLQEQVTRDRQADQPLPLRRRRDLLACVPVEHSDELHRCSEALQHRADPPRKVAAEREPE